MSNQLWCSKHGFNLECRAKHGVMADNVLRLPKNEDTHERIMSELRFRLRRAVPTWYSRDLFWEELQKVRQCEHENDYTDAEWMGALEALDDRLRGNASLCTRMALKPGLGPRSLEDRRDPAAKERRDYMGVVKRFKWYHHDVFWRFLREVGGENISMSTVSERLFLDCLLYTSPSPRDS